MQCVLKGDERYAQYDEKAQQKIRRKERKYLERASGKKLTSQTAIPKKAQAALTAICTGVGFGAQKGRLADSARD